MRIRGGIRVLLIDRWRRLQSHTHTKHCIQSAFTSMCWIIVMQKHSHPDSKVVQPVCQQAVPPVSPLPKSSIPATSSPKTSVRQNICSDQNCLPPPPLLHMLARYTNFKGMPVPAPCSWQCASFCCMPGMSIQPPPETRRWLMQKLHHFHPTASNANNNTVTATCSNSLQPQHCSQATFPASKYVQQPCTTTVRPIQTIYTTKITGRQLHTHCSPVFKPECRPCWRPEPSAFRHHSQGVRGHQGQSPSPRAQMQQHQAVGPGSPCSHGTPPPVCCIRHTQQKLSKTSERFIPAHAKAYI